MDERKNNNHPWDDSVYGTGRTEPPKSHGGTVALLLILIIFLCGIITVLGVLNVRLFQKLNTRRESEQSISFATGAELPRRPPPFPRNPLTPPWARTLPPSTCRNALRAWRTSPPRARCPFRKFTAGISTPWYPSPAPVRAQPPPAPAWILTEDGYIVTNCHVVENGISITAQLTGRPDTARHAGGR